MPVKLFSIQNSYYHCIYFQKRKWVNYKIQTPNSKFQLMLIEFWNLIFYNLTHGDVLASTGNVIG